MFFRYLEKSKRNASVQKGSKLDPANFMSIALTSIVCKVIEEIMGYSLTNDLVPENFNANVNTDL